jgi:hypothetical protein
LNILEGFRPGFQDISARQAQDAGMTAPPQGSTKSIQPVSCGQAAERLRFDAADNVALAQDFALYPGAHSDDKADRSVSAANPGVECRVFVTGDSFEKIYAFYRGRYKEFAFPLPEQKLPDGRVVKWAFFILDGASSLSRSRYWMKIQRPAIDSVNDAGEFTNIRDITVIETLRKP